MKLEKDTIISHYRILSDAVDDPLTTGISGSSDKITVFHVSGRVAFDRSFVLVAGVVRFCRIFHKSVYNSRQRQG